MKKWFETPGPIAEDEVSRRTFIKVASLLLGGALPLASWTGCGGDPPPSGLEDPPGSPGQDAATAPEIDAGAAGPDAGITWPDGGTVTCGSGTVLCLPLSSTANAALRSVGGARVVLGAPNGDDLIVARTGASTFIALSAICTHDGCTVAYRPTKHDFLCPCHAAQFRENGTVLAGPARRALTVYAAAQSSDLKYVLVRL